MPKIKPIIAETPEDLADALGLPRIAAEGWRFQHVLLARLKESAGRQKLTHLLDCPADSAREGVLAHTTKDDQQRWSLMCVIKARWALLLSAFADVTASRSAPDTGIGAFRAVLAGAVKVLSCTRELT